jgi:hypothetical protein
MKKLSILLAIMLVTTLLFSAPSYAADDKSAAATAETAVVKDAAATTEVKAAEIVSPKDIYDKVQTGEILLVCAYPDDEKFAKSHLKGAISFKDFEAQIKDAGQSKLIVFY